MKRTFDGWALVWPDDGAIIACFLQKPKRAPYSAGKLVPCTITYDDGKRTKRGKK